MKTIFCIVLFFISLIIFSCNEEPASNNETPVIPSVENFKYPYALNSFWLYSTRNFLTNLRGDSIWNYFNTDTIDGNGAAEFRKDTIINNDTLRILYNSHSMKGHSHTTIELYKQTESGLLRKAFYSDGTNFGPYRPIVNSLVYSFEGKIFNSIEEIFTHYKNDLRDNFSSDTLIFDEPPILTIKYPIVRNTEWLLDNVSSWNITKKYIDFETVNLENGSYYCIKIQRLYYPNGTQTPETNLIYYDYFSKEGMVKKDFLVKDILIFNQSSDTLGILDAKEEAELILFTP